MHVTFSDYFASILRSGRDDWNVIGCSGAGPSYRDKLIEWSSRDLGKWLEVRSHPMVATLKSDLDISLAFGLDCNKDFVEAWANGFPDPKASSHFVDFFFRGSLVHRDVYVTVDGGRGNLPLPIVEYNDDYSKIISLTVTQDADSFYRLFNQLENTSYEYDDYRKRAGIEVIPGSWPK